MDSLSQIVLGGAVAALIAPAAHRRAALLAGAALGTLPDLDSLPIALFSANPVTLMTVHRSFSHSLFVLPLVGWLIWWLFKRFGNGRVAASPARWFWAIQLALVTHPLLDAFTVYGTQLWWPLTPPRSPRPGSISATPVSSRPGPAGSACAWPIRAPWSAPRIPPASSPSTNCRRSG